MTSSEPLHLVGPFTSQQQAFSWGSTQEQHGGGDFGWQIVWSSDPTKVPILRSPADCQD
jgi:hypothetical protein